MTSTKAAKTTTNEAKMLGVNLERVAPELLHFDVNNPRFGGTKVGRKQPDIQKHLLEEPHYASELIDSFLENDFIDYEPLVVRREGDHFVVIEGNRRLAAVKEIRANLSHYKKGDAFLAKIPVLIFPENDATDTAGKIRVYLGVRHLLGLREWPPFAKAQFLDNEAKKTGDLDRVLREVRLKKADARRLLIPYRLLKKAKIDLNEEDFWMLAEALQRQGVKAFTQLDVDTKQLEIKGYDKAKLDTVIADLYGPVDATGKLRTSTKRKVSDTRMLSMYSTVLSSDKAEKVLHKGKSLDEASIYVDSQEQSISKLQNDVRRLGVLIKKATAGDKTGEAKSLNDSYRVLESSVKEFARAHA